MCILGMKLKPPKPKPNFQLLQLNLKMKNVQSSPSLTPHIFLHLSGLNIKFLPCTLVGGIKCQNAQVIIGYTHLQANAKRHKL